MMGRTLCARKPPFDCDGAQGSASSQQVSQQQVLEFDNLTIGSFKGKIVQRRRIELASWQGWIRALNEYLIEYISRSNDAY